MSENERLIADFAGAVSHLVIVSTGSGGASPSMRGIIQDAKAHVTELERKILSRMKVKEPL